MIELKSISAGYDRMTVNRNIDLTISPGKILLVLGPNGAGKTTLMRALSGMIPVSSGEISLDGEPFGKRHTEQLARDGIRHVLEGHRVFPEISVEDNIRLGQAPVARDKRLTTEELLERAFDVFPILGEKRKLLARSLSGGQQQMLALVQAWSGQPRFLLCDEPSLGLAQALIPDILTFLKARAAEGMGVVLVEQLVDQPLAVADEVVMIKQGEIVFKSEQASMDDRDDLVNLMLD